jgi:polyphenol oxidase
MMLKTATLTLPGIRHAFFTRAGGVSNGLYASLNGGIGSHDDAGHVAENRARMAAALSVAPDCLLTAYQIHSPHVVVAETPWPMQARPRADAIVTRTPGLAIGVSTADCGPILLADPVARVIGAAHAGWRGALAGVIEATVVAMERFGATRRGIVGALGPCIAQASYEVGPEFVAAFAAVGEAVPRFFAPSRKARHSMFDLNACIADRVARAGIGRFEDLRLDTYADERRFFSYRRATHRKEPDYGRLVSAIALG